MNKTAIFQRLTQRRPLLMGVLNLTPDSFHDGGRYNTLPAAQAQLHLLVEQGADIIDVGGASSRPGYTAVTPEEELARVLPLLQAEARNCPALISIDTEHVAVAQAALAAGADMINDTSGLLEPKMFRLALAYDADLILMERHGVSGQGRILSRVDSFFRAGLALGDELGLSRQHLILDPGPGFDKNEVESAVVMESLPLWRAFGCPLLAAYSHKRFIARHSQEQPGNTPLGNAWAARHYTALGADILRVHQVAAAVQALAEGPIVEEPLPLWNQIISEGSFHG